MGEECKVAKRVAGLCIKTTAVVVAGIGLAGCGTSSSTSAAKASNLVKGTIVVALSPQVSPNWYFPLLSLTADSSVNNQIDSLMYKRLIFISSRTDKFVPDRSIASAIHYNAQGTQYTLTLNPKWHWSNGHQVTARDVVFAWDIIKAASSSNPKSPWGFAGMGSGGVPSIWKSVRAQNSHTVVVTLTEPRNQQWFIHNGLSQLIPLPESVWNKDPHNMMAELAYIKSVANNPYAAPYRVVDGPFEFKSFAPNQDWVFVPNSHYAGHKAQFSKLLYQYESSSSAEFSALKTGTIDVGYLPQSLYNVRTQLTHDVFSSYYMPAFNYILPNLNSKAPSGIGLAFQQLPVRQALQMAVNQTAIINTLYHGYAVPTYGPVVAKPSTPFFNPALKKNPYPFNPQAGKALLEKNGWQMVNGVMHKGPLALQFSLAYVSGSSTDQSIVELLQQDWAREGIKVSLVPQPFDTIIAYSPTDSGQWAMEFWGGGWGYGTSYPTGGVLFSSTGAENSGSYDSTTMNTLIQKTYDPGTPVQIQQRLYQYEMYAAKNLPGIYIPLPAHFQEHITTMHNTLKHRYAPNYWFMTQSS